MANNRAAAKRKLRQTILYFFVLICFAKATQGFSQSSNTKKTHIRSQGVSSNTQSQKLNEDSIIKQINDNMVQVEGGTFSMGKNGMYDNEKPTHDITVSSFYISKYEVTQQQWQLLMFNNPSYSKCDNCPIENITYLDAVNFCQRLSAHTGKTFRLPTEAEWEYAATGGNKSSGYIYSGSNTIDEIAWYNRNADNQTHPVGEKQSNELGLYDMTGNVWEWCSDWYDDNYYSSSPAQNPTGPSSGTTRVIRGGSWYYAPLYCRVINRYNSDPSGHNSGLGFRIVVSF